MATIKGLNHPPPPGWGLDELSRYLDTAYTNRWATFYQNADHYRGLREIDDIFLAIAYGWKDPPHTIEAFLFGLCHASFRGACEHALGGQTGLTYPLARGCLENSAYALHMLRNPTLSDVWLDRHKDESSLKKVRNEFSHTKVLSTIRGVAPDLATEYSTLYDRCIDFGAHPNELALFSSMVIKGSDGQRVLGQIMVRGGGVHMEHDMFTVAEAGLCALRIFAHVFPERYAEVSIHSKLAAMIGVPAPP